ncbi:short-chain fatty acyl-CoA regulator family protein [Roseovarius sp. SCSIO 43702]|uniref:short-chain fatty acyl-CoA regulator family protein n=1 Tax=Roseovarius sp. SCSIO 43702 TaxID=2823043 RepID=UPI001C73A83F|nr:short-chain fatty acyl-CoA regulator family protein [Roseovarius sp. SCSIO 43702]QYX56050.1 short-chain fatty acyl-CoA regulator family protein [Roseovarius sp. SCSIO 43702]
MGENDAREIGLVGSRIRERRLALGIRQAHLAEEVGISPSYLNLIEHNRRRIAGGLVLHIADALKVEPALLTRGPAAALVGGLREAAKAVADEGLDLAAAEEFAERFPGWAELLIRGRREIGRLEQAVEALTDRLSHDPDLAGKLHEVLSVVTAIRSTASILVETPDLETGWLDRFHRNIHQDSRRLAEGAAALVSYLETPPGEHTGTLTPQEEFDAFLDARGHHFPALEQPGAAPAEIVEGAEELRSDGGRTLALEWLKAYDELASELPLRQMTDMIGRVGVDPVALAGDLGVGLPDVMRRLAHLPEALVGELGHVACDGAGAVTQRRPVAGFAVPRGVGACPLWPLYLALGQPGQPLRLAVRQTGRDPRWMTAFAVSEVEPPSGYQMPPLRRAQMLLVPASRPPDDHEPTLDTGITCRICPRPDCTARREPSILRDAF